MVTCHTGAMNSSPHLPDHLADPAAQSELCTAINCSVGLPQGQLDLDRAVAAGVQRIELWWPWNTPEPHTSQIEDLAAELLRRQLTLIAVNFWGGDMSAGDRGVLHTSELSQGHLDAMSRFVELTGVKQHNLLLGRGGRKFTDVQRERVGQIAQWACARGSMVLIEPSKGASDYPVQTFADALAITDTVPGTALLADFWHLAGEGGTGGVDRVDAWLQQISLRGDVPAHVQLADDPGRCTPGEGVLPLARWVSELRAAGYAGDIAGEWVW